MSGSEPTQREINPLMTTESSTTITRSGSCSVDFGHTGFTNATLITHQTRLKRHDRQNADGRSRRIDGPKSDKADFLELRGNDVLVERLHDVFVGPGMKRARDVGDIVFGGAEHHLGRIATGHAAEIAQEFVSIHDRHIPIEQDGVGQAALADFQRLLAVLGFDDLEIKALQDSPRDLPYDTRVIDNQTCSHLSLCFLQSREGHFHSTAFASLAALRRHHVRNDFEDAIDVENDHELAIEAMDTAG